LVEGTGRGGVSFARVRARRARSVRRGEDLTEYYTAEGNPVGQWLGSGLANLSVSGPVSEEQMRALFGEGLHPDAEASIRVAVAGGATPEDAVQASRLGRRFPRIQTIADAGAQAVMARVTAVTAPALNPVPEALQRQDGDSVYRVHGTERFTSARILAIEDSLIDAGRTIAGFAVDPAQLAAVESGGALRLIEQRVGASYLDQVHRFVDVEEAAASLLLRDGANSSVDVYITADRTRGGIRQSMLEEIYVAWAADRADHRHSIMVAGTNEEVAALNARARLDLIGQGAVGKSGALLHDENKAGLNDVIVTRQNDRQLRSNQGKDFVANGDLWTILSDEGGDLKVKSLRHGGVLTLPTEYVVTHVELGYAATIDRVQGMTVDTSHNLVNPQSTSREQLYVAATRGRESNRMYVVVEETLEVDAHAPDHLRTSIRDALTAGLGRESSERSATEEIQRG